MVGLFVTLVLSHEALTWEHPLHATQLDVSASTTSHAVSGLSGATPSATRPRCIEPRARLFATAANLGVIEIDPIKGTVLRTFAPPSQQGVADGLAFDGSHLFYVNGSREPNRLYALDPATGVTTASDTLPPSAFRNGLATLDGAVYILDWSAITQDITVWDPESRRVVRTLDINGANPEAPAISGGLASASGPDALLVTTAQTNELLEISPTSGRITHRFNHGLSGALGVAVINNRVYLGTNTSSDLRVFSRAGQLEATVEVEGAIGFQSLGGDALGAMQCTLHLPLSIRFGR